MNSSTSCLTHERLRQLSHNELSPREMEQLDDHVTHCDACCRMLEEAGAEPDWQRELRAALSDVSDSPAFPAHAHSSTIDAPHDADGSVEHFVKLLGPTDDPRMLGRIGPYEIVGILGRGGMGVVFKGFDAVLNRYVAVKMLLPHLATSGAARKRFAREAQAAAAVVDDHVMAIHGVAEWQGIPYLVMPYTRGLSLQKRLNEQGPLELREILRIGMQAAAGLAAAHAQGLIHRDVKPANMLLAEGVERVTLVDFGLARTIDDASLTQTGFLAGTPQYMSPEQARSEPVDARSDLFSLGSVMYAACTGRAPFRSETSYGVLRQITDSEPRPIRELNPDVPEWLCRIVERLMAKQPAERFSSAAEVSQLLADCLAHVQQPQRISLPDAVAKLLPTPTHQAKSRFVKRVIAMSTMLTSLLMGVFVWMGTNPPDIAGTWSDAEWGEVTLTATQPGEYQGRYATTHNQQPGEMRVAWSRLERRFNGAWSEGADCHGEVSLRLVDQELRGSYTTDASSRIEPGLKPKLGDLRYVRVERTEAGEKAGVTAIDPESASESKRIWTLAWMKKVPNEIPDSVDRTGAQKWLLEHGFQGIETGDFTEVVMKTIHPDADQKLIQRDGVRYFVRGVLRANRAEEKGAAIEVYFLFSEADKLVSLRVGPLVSDSPKQPADATREEIKVSRTVRLVDFEAAILRQLDGRWELEPGQEPADTRIPRWGEFEFREGLLSHLKQGKVVFQGKLEIDALKSPPTILAKDITGGPSFIGGTIEMPDDKSLWISMPDTSVRRGDGKQPNRVWLFRRIAVKPPTREKNVGPTKEDPYRTGPIPPGGLPMPPGSPTGQSDEFRVLDRPQSPGERANSLPPLDGKAGPGFKIEIRHESNEGVGGDIQKASGLPETKPDESARGTKIYVTKITEQLIEVAGEADSIHELVLRLEKTERTKQLEWNSSLNGKFRAELSSTDKLPLGDGKQGKGIVFKVQQATGRGGTFNIATSESDVVPSGTIRFRSTDSTATESPAIKQVGDVITVAELVCDDGTTVPITILVRQRQESQP